MQMRQRIYTRWGVGGLKIERALSAIFFFSFEPNLDGTFVELSGGPNGQKSIATFFSKLQTPFLAEPNWDIGTSYSPPRLAIFFFFF